WGRQRFEIAFDIEKIDIAQAAIPMLGQRRSKRQGTDAQRLVVALAVSHEAAARFEHAHALQFAIDVRAQDVEQASQQRGAHDVEVARDRVEHPDRRRIGVQQALAIGADEAERDDLVVVTIDQAVPQSRCRANALRRRQHRLRMPDRSRRDIVVAVQARHLLDEVFFDRQIEAIRRRRDDEVGAFALRGEAQAREDRSYRLGCDRDAEDACDARAAHSHRIAPRQRAANVGQWAGAAPADGDDQLRRTFDRRRAYGEINAALKAKPGIGGETEPARLALDHRRIPECALEKDRLRAAADAAMLPAHDAGEAERLGLVSDQQQVGVEIERLPVEQRQLLAGPGKANDDIAIEHRVVVGMERLSELEHHVVGYVDNGRDGADAAALDALPDPCRRRSGGIDALDDAAAKTRARQWILDADAAPSGAAGGRRLERRLRQRYPGDRRDFAREAQDRQAVGTIRRQLDLEHGIVEVEDTAQVGADRRIRIEQQQPRRI